MSLTARPFRFRLATLFLSVVCLTVAPSATRQADRVHFDGRLELFSILYHLAGAPGYSRPKLPAYAAAVAEHFRDSKDHPAVQDTVRMFREFGAGFFHPMNLAVHLTPLPALAERTPFDQPGHGLGRRWPAERVRPYLANVRAFYEEARVEAFFKTQRPLYAQLEAGLQQLLERDGDPAWFETFFGARPPATFFIAPAPLNGGAQYAAKFVSPSAPGEAHAVIGIYKVTEAGAARFDRDDAVNIVHEFAHTLTDAEVTAILPQLATAGPALFARVQDRMREQSYGEWQTMVHEAIVRAVTVRYIAAHWGDEAARQEIEAQHTAGFVTTGALSNLFAEYSTNRPQYPRFRDVMPRVIQVFEAAAKADEHSR